MTLDQMISKLDTACGMLLVASMKDPIVRQAMEIVTSVSIALSETAFEAEIRSSRQHRKARVHNDNNQ